MKNLEPKNTVTTVEITSIGKSRPIEDNEIINISKEIGETPTITASTKASTLQVAELSMHQGLEDLDNAVSYTTI
jgi:hypothetical protein